MFKSSLMVCGKPFLCFCVVNCLFVFQIIKFSRFRNWNMLKFAFIKTLPHLYPKKRKNNSKRMFNLQHVHLFWIVFCSFFAFLSGSKLDKENIFFSYKMPNFGPYQYSVGAFIYLNPGKVICLPLLVHCSHPSPDS